MGKPTANDPLGQGPDPADFGDAMNAMIDARIELRIRGRTNRAFDNMGDITIVQELLARGWAVFRPTTKNVV